MEDMSEGDRMAMEAMDAEDEGLFDSLERWEGTPGEWETGPNNGSQLIAIVKMTDTHLANAIAWCEKNNKDSTRKYGELLAEQRRRALTAAVGRSLGERAIALALAHEFGGSDTDAQGASYPVCPTCLVPFYGWMRDRKARGPVDGIHKSGCEWGAIVAEAKAKGLTETK
jgi:hypothetical protein